MIDLPSDVPSRVPLYRYISQIAKKHGTDTGNGSWTTDISAGKRYTAADVDVLSGKVANFLRKQGFRSQDIVLYNTNRLEACIMFLGIWRLNGIVRASYPGESTETLAEILEECNGRVAICDKKTAPAVLAASQKVAWPVLVVCVDPFEGCTHFDEVLKESDRDAPEESNVDIDNDLCAIFNTGGTTGKSKGAAWTHSRYVGSLTTSKWIMPAPEKHTIVSTSAITHIGGLSYVLYALRNSNHYVIFSNSTTEDFIEAIREYKPSAITGFPPSVGAIATHRNAKSEYFDSVLTICTLGGTMADAHKEALKRIMKNLTTFQNFYGSTETNGICCTFDAAATLKTGECWPMYEGIKDGCIGRPLPHVEARVVHQDTGENVAANEHGEILIRTPFVMKGYYKNPEATESAFTNGWYRTGDLGFCDENGFLYYVTRIKDTFKYFGNHISSLELETIILQIPDVLNTSVIGIPDPDHPGSEIPRAFVVKEEGSSLTSQDVTDYVNARVADYKHIRGGVAFIDQLPQTRAGKVSRVQIRQMYMNGEI